MYTVYILLSQRDGRLYVGCASNVENRLKKHNGGHVYATKNRRPLCLIYTESLLDKAQAFNRERFFKSLWAGRLKKKILSDYLKNHIEI